MLFRSFLAIVRAYRQVYPYVTLWQMPETETSESHPHLIGSMVPVLPDYGIISARLSRPEITRDIAERFNRTYKRDLFKLPEPYIPETVATIIGTDGKRKMSKTLGNVISIFEDEEVIKKQVMGCYTDPTRAHANDPGHSEGNMVFTYLDFLGEPKRVEELKSLYKEGKVSDVEVKEYLFESLMIYFVPARKRYQELKNNPDEVKKILKSGAEKARSIASQTLAEVRSLIGLNNKYSL